MAGSKIGYMAGNISDQFKHANLEFLVRELNPYQYIEFHSGEGKYEGGYEGSALRVLRILQKKEGVHYFYLHEIRSDARQKLKKNVNCYQNVFVGGDWRKNKNKYLDEANRDSLFLIDPTYIKDYERQIDNSGLLNWIPSIIESGANLFMYAPQKNGDLDDYNIIEEIRNCCVSGIEAVDLMHEVNTGHFARTDHSFIVAKKEICYKIIDYHTKLGIQLQKKTDVFMINI